MGITLLLYIYKNVPVVRGSKYDPNMTISRSVKTILFLGRKYFLLVMAPIMLCVQASDGAHAANHEQP
jgi:hypothetical protein